MTNDIFAFETFASNRPSSLKQGTTHNDPKKSTKSQKKSPPRPTTIQRITTMTQNNPKNFTKTYHDLQQSKKKVALTHYDPEQSTTIHNDDWKNPK